ncbi:MAG: ATP-binding protein [Dongiaceae bacterium]
MKRVIDEPAEAGAPRLFDLTPRWRPLRWIGFALLAALVLAYGSWIAGTVARNRALAEMERAGQSGNALYVAALRSELEKQGSLPFVLAQDADVHDVLEKTPDAPSLTSLNEKLEALSDGTRAAVIYLLDVTGRAIAASNWREPTSFVGNDYAFRPYFTNAVRGGATRYFAMGTVSHRPGLYLSRRIDHGSGPSRSLLGVVVVKVEFEAIENSWQQSAGPVFVTDGRGIVLVTSIPDWRFRTLAPLSPVQQAEILESQQFGTDPLERLDLTADPAAERPDIVRAARPGTAAPAAFMETRTTIPNTDWTVHYLLPVSPAVEPAILQARIIAILATLILFAAIGIVLRRRDYAAANAAMQTAIRADLEQRVEERTSELQSSNDRLVAEIEERHRAQLRLQQLQDELVRANKMALLGQITANVAHEVNQPVSAIRSYADNSLVFLDRGQPDAARQNLQVIAGLTERIGVITDELRNFMRKSASRIVPIHPAEAIDGALLRVGHRLRQQGIHLRRDPIAGDIRVAAERIRLEQVLVNLLQNALEALAGQPGARIAVTASWTEDWVTLAVADNGPGLAPETADDLFTPFVTTKADGLGLGLVICRDIVTEFGGTLHARNGEAGGAIFTITLRRTA